MVYGPEIHYVARVPNFPGFYNSWLSQELDHIEEQDVVFFEENQEEEKIQQHLRLTQEEIAEILFDCVSYAAMHEEVAELYAEAFDQELSMHLGWDTGLMFESMDSPREYNFTTDRLFVWMPRSTLYRLFVRCAEETYETLEHNVKQRFTSRDGFSSHYDSDVRTWMSTPLEEWDHNQISELIRANVTESVYTDVMYALVYDDSVYSAFSDNVDWKAYEQRVTELRAEKEEEWLEDNPGEELPYRCPDTPDMFGL